MQAISLYWFAANQYIQMAKNSLFNLKFRSEFNELRLNFEKHQEVAKTLLKLKKFEKTHISLLLSLTQIYSFLRDLYISLYDHHLLEYLRHVQSIFLQHKLKTEQVNQHSWHTDKGHQETTGNPEKRWKTTEAKKKKE